MPSAQDSARRSTLDARRSTLDALAAGNRVVVEPPDRPPSCGHARALTIAERFDEGGAAVVHRDLALAKCVPALPWVRLVATGSVAVRRECMQPPDQARAGYAGSRRPVPGDRRPRQGHGPADGRGDGRRADAGAPSDPTLTLPSDTLA
jgi:hypothetical protein